MSHSDDYTVKADASVADWHVSGGQLHLRDPDLRIERRLSDEQFATIRITREGMIVDIYGMNVLDSTVAIGWDDLADVVASLDPGRTP